MKLFIRALLISIPRFFMLIVLTLFVTNFDVSPLPFWTLIAFSYLMDAVISYVFALWVYHKQEIHWSGVALTASVFVVFGILLELGLDLFIKPNVSLAQIAASYSWQSLAVIAAYAIGVVLAGYQKILKSRRHVLAEGMAV